MKTLDEIKEWALAQKRQCRLNVAARDLIKVVEGRNEFRDNDRRLKDTTEWCEFYCATKRLDEEGN